MKKPTFMKKKAKIQPCQQSHNLDKQNFASLHDEMTAHQELIKYCEEKRREAMAACMQQLKQHIILYLDENLSNSWQHKDQIIKLRQIDDEYEIILRTSGVDRGVSYEEWIRQCHPENARGFNCDKNSALNNSSIHSLKIDNRFYLEKSDHRMMWNECMSSYGHPELMVRARQ